MILQIRTAMFLMSKALVTSVLKSDFEEVTNMAHTRLSFSLIILYSQKNDKILDFFLDSFSGKSR